MKTIIITPQLVNRIEKKVNRLMVEWQIPADERHTIYQMVATKEAGVKTNLFYYKGGLIYDGWNGYKGVDSKNPNPRDAWGGFYRLDQYQMVGWSIYLIVSASNKQGQINRCYSAYGLVLSWEDKPCVWGYKSFQDYYTLEEQEEAANQFIAQPHVKRVVCEGISEFSGMYRLQVETTRKKSGLQTEWRARVAK